MPDDSGYSLAEKYPDHVPELPELDDHALFLMGVFSDLSSRRASGFSAPQPIPYAEIKARCELTGVPLRPDEVEAVVIMDQAHLSAIADAQERQRDAKEKGSGSR